MTSKLTGNTATPHEHYVFAGFFSVFWKGVEIMEGQIMPDHIRLLLSIQPQDSISQLMGYLKGKNVMMIFDRHSNLKYKLGIGSSERLDIM